MYKPVKLRYSITAGLCCSQPLAFLTGLLHGLCPCPMQMSCAAHTVAIRHRLPHSYSRELPERVKCTWHALPLLKLSNIMLIMSGVNGHWGPVRSTYTYCMKDHTTQPHVYLPPEVRSVDAIDTARGAAEAGNSDAGQVPVRHAMQYMS